MAKYVLFDSCFWFALYDAGDEHHEEALILADDLSLDNLVLPWPCLYETLNTRFVRHVPWSKSFQGLLRQRNVSVLEDEPYREAALAAVFDVRIGLRLSLVDAVIREMLRDPSVRLDAMATFNTRDFADVCAKRNIEMIMG
jgi:predicted nucleic acid-binding protein